MTGVDIRSLVRKLDAEMIQILEKAVAAAVAQSHPTVEILHLWSSVLERQRGDLKPMFRDLPLGDASAQVVRALDRLARGNAGYPAFSADLIKVFSDAWLQVSMADRRDVGFADIARVMASDAAIWADCIEVIPALATIRSSIVLTGAIESENSDFKHQENTIGKSSEFLDEYTTDLSLAAENGELDPVVGRERELAQVVDILLRRRQNNPILVGEAGVGKTAIAEAFAMAVAAGKIPHRLQDVRTYVLDLALLQAGAGVKGEFERRLKGVISDVGASPVPIILFIDEAHSLVGAGNQPGQGDAANILKPALARGELRTIAATTWSEYKKYFEKDPALTRRFEVVKVDEPDAMTAIRMLRSVAPKLAAHHGVEITEDGIEAAVTLSARYMPARQLPDKAVSLLDTAAAAVAVSREGIPFALESMHAERNLLSAELQALQKDRLSVRAARRRIAVEKAIAETAAAIVALEKKLAVEDDHLATIDRAEAGDDAAYRDSVAALLAVQGETPLRHHSVNQELIAGLVARATGIPVGKLLADQIEVARSLEERLGARVKGQDGAIARIARILKTARVQLTDSEKPPAVFLFLGMSGVGKTEMAHAIADTIYGGSQNLTILNMSEYKEEHRVSQLVGSPAGYVGFGEGGVLTEAVRRRPYGVLLLDEIEKAHVSVQEIFYQVFDKGVLRDGEGRDIDFKNTTIILTANSASAEIAALAQDPETFPDDPEALLSAVRPALLRDFKPAFLGRLMPVVFNPLDGEALRDIVRMQLAKVIGRVKAVYDSDLLIESSVEDLLIGRARASDTGARAIQSMIGHQLLPALSDFILGCLSRKTIPSEIRLMCNAGGQIEVAASIAVSAASEAPAIIKDASTSGLGA